MLYPMETGLNILCHVRTELVDPSGAVAKGARSLKVCKLSMTACSDALPCKAVALDTKRCVLMVEPASPAHIES